MNHYQRKEEADTIVGAAFFILLFVLALPFIAPVLWFLFVLIQMWAKGVPGL